MSSLVLCLLHFHVMTWATLAFTFTASRTLDKILHEQELTLAASILLNISRLSLCSLVHTSTSTIVPTCHNPLAPYTSISPACARHPRIHHSHKVGSLTLISLRM